jgi:hypothetical protein
MRHRRLSIALVLLAAWTAGSGTILAAPAEKVLADPVPLPEWWKAVAASGPVETRPGMIEQAWAPVRRGDLLDPRDLVRTGRRGRATLTRHGDILMVDPDSQVELPPLTGEQKSVVQSSGSVIYEVDRRDGRSFQVVTPYLVAGVKGTVFMVTVSDSHASVTVEEGLVEVTSLATGETLDVGAGESVHLDAMNDAEMEHVTLLTEGDRSADPASKEARKMARADLRRLAHAAAQRHEIIMDDSDPIVGPGEGGADDPSTGELDSRERNAIEEDLETHRGDLTNEDPSEELVNRKETTQDVNQAPQPQ